MKQPTHISLAALVLLAGLWLRLPAVDWGLPYVLHPDEPTNYRVVRRMVTEQTFDPKFFNYPSLFLNVQAVAQLSWTAAARVFTGDDVSGRFELPQMQAMATGRVHDLLSFRFSRSVTLVFALATLAIVVALTWRLTHGAFAALIAGAVFGVSGLALENAALITPDSYAAFFTLLALAAAFAVLRIGSGWTYALAGLATGLATGAKYNAVLVAVAIAAAHVLRFGRTALTSPRAWGWGTVTVVCAMAGFVLTTPMAALDPAAVWAGITYERAHYARGQVGHEGDALLFYLRTLVRSEGFAFAGLVLALLHPRLRSAAFVLTLFVICYVGVIGSYNVHFARNLMPVVPAIAVLAGIGADAVWTRSRTWNVGRRRLLAAAFALLLVVPQTVRATAWRGSQRAAQRAAARDWVQSHIRPGAVIMVDAFGPWLPDSRYRVGGSDRLRVARATEAALIVSDVVVVASSGSGLYLTDPDRYPADVKRIEALRARSCFSEVVTEGDYWAEILVLDCSVLAPPPDVHAP